MTLEEKLKLFKDKGWTCNPDTGEIFSHTGRLIDNRNTKDKWSYTICSIYQDKEIIKVKAHQLMVYLITDKTFEQIDHINGDTNDNRLINLRGVNQNINQWNRKGVKGYTKRGDRFIAQIRLNNKRIHLGLFNTEQEARQAYLDAKKLYHII